MTKRTIDNKSSRKSSLRYNVMTSSASRQTSQFDEVHLQRLQAFAERDARAHRLQSRTVRATREGRGVATRPEYGVVLLWPDEGLIVVRG